MKDTPLLITLNNFPESCHLCRIGLVKNYADAHKLRITDHFSLCMVKSGSMQIFNGDTILAVRAGDIYITYPGVVARNEFLEPDTQLYAVEFTKEFLEYNPNGITIKDRFIRFLIADEVLGKGKYQLIKVVLPGDDKNYVKKQIERFDYEFNRRREGMFELLQNILIGIINVCGCSFLYRTDVSHAEKNYSKVNDLLVNSVDYIHKNFRQRLSVDEIVERFATSRTTYCTMFKKVYGVTFYEYLTGIRMEKAVQLLLETDMSMDEVAINAGFNDSATLYRKFIQFYGVSPGKYKKENREGV